MKKSLYNLRGKIALLLCGAFFMLVAAEIFPAFTIGFWRIAYASECAIGFVGPGGSTAEGTLISQRFGATPTATLSYHLLYKVGNSQGKAYALMGLRDIDWDEYVILRDDFALSAKKVFVHSGCTGDEMTPESAVLFIEEIHCSESRREETIKKLRNHFDQLRNERKKT